jgi:hypothetical protein
MGKYRSTIEADDIDGSIYEDLIVGLNGDDRIYGGNGAQRRRNDGLQV